MLCRKYYLQEKGVDLGASMDIMKYFNIVPKKIPRAVWLGPAFVLHLHWCHVPSGTLSPVHKGQRRQIAAAFDTAQHKLGRKMPSSQHDTTTP